MKPIEFTVSKVVLQSAFEISEGIADVDNWDDYDGCGFLPGIEKAFYEDKTEDLKGSIIRVHNSDGTKHREVFLEWIWGEKIVVKIYDFPLALSTVASHFIESWNFKENKEKAETLVTRKFQLFPTSFLSRPFISQIASMIEKAAINHLDEIARKALKKHNY